MPRRMTPNELARLQRYMPPGWRERAELPLSPEALEACGAHLQALLSAVGTYLPRAVLTGDQDLQPGQGVFRHGTTLFADVSGFSTLTERFSQERGREGAEEITRIVNQFLEAVNGIAIRYGGDLLKFAGDAALSFYQGEAHAARACRAAWEMQQAMQERFARVETSLGEFPLRMSIGLGTGQLLMVSLGSAENAEYAVMGPAMATMGRAEYLAQAGQIVIDRGTYELAGDVVTAIPAGEADFFEVRGSEPRPSAVERPNLGLLPPEGTPTATLRWLLARLDGTAASLPHGLLEKLVPLPGEVGVESDHRWVTTLFADLRGVDDLVAAVGLAHVGLLTQVVNRYFLAMRDVVEQYEGVLHKVGAGPSGPHLFITFGAPKSHPDDPERAVRAALGMQAALAEVNQAVAALADQVPGCECPPFRQAIGITTGFVFAGSIGSERRWEYTVMGDLVNLAARLMTVADDGETLVADSTVRYLGERFKLLPREPMQVKGKQELVSYALVTGVTQLPPVLGSAAGKLVGRQAEVSTAQALLDRAAQGQGSVLAIQGEAGMGKTRLTQEIAQQAQSQGLRVVAGACLSYGGDIPYLPWTDVLRALLGATGTERPAQVTQVARGLAAAGLSGWEPLVAQAMGLEAEETELTASLEPRLRQQRLFDIVLDLIHYHAGTQPLLLVIEDVQWADPTSLELLDYVARNVASSPVVLLILHRPREWLDGRWVFQHGVHISLRELPAAAVRALIADLLRTGEVPDRLIALGLRKAQGNPFFTEELVRELMDAGVLSRTNAHWELTADPDQAGVPDTIHGVIQSRMDRLEETNRRVLQVASVIGRVFGSRVLDGAYPYDDLDSTLEQRLSRLGSLGMVQLELPEPELIYMFRHALTQDVAYQSLPYQRRRDIHCRVGEFVESQGGETVSERPGFLAHHFFQGQAWRRALRYSLAAGRKAQQEYANEVAVAHYERALRAAAEVEAPDLEDRLAALEGLGEVLTIVGRHDEALGHLAEARNLVRSLPHSETGDRRLADLYSKAAQAYESKGDYPAAMAQLEKGLALPGITQAVQGAALYLMGAGVFHRQGDNQRAEEWCRRGLQVAEQLDDPQAQAVLARGNYVLGASLVRQGELDRAIEHCRRGVTLYEAAHHLFGQAQAHNNLGMVYYDRGDFAQAAEHYRLAAAIVSQIGYSEGEARAATNLGEIYLVQGDLDAAQEQYRVALDIVERLGMLYGKAVLHNNLGAALARGGRWVEAAEHLEQSWMLFQEIGSEDFTAEILRHQAEVALGQGDLDRAQALAERSLAQAQASDMRLEEGVTWRVLGCIRRERGDLDQAESALAQALEIAQETRKRYEEGLLHLELARLRTQQGRDEGEALARRAAEILGELGAQLDLEEAERLMA